MTRDRTWTADAACSEEDPDLFFFPDLAVFAKRICRGCPVRQRCLAYALGEHITDGTWGGLTEDERDALVRAAAARGAADEW